MATDPKWLTGLGLIPVSEGVWRDDATSQLVCKVGHDYWVRPHQMYWAIVKIAKRRATVEESGGDNLNAEHRACYDAALTLAAQIAQAYNEQKEE